MLDVTAEERDVLVQVLRNALSDLRSEIYKTEDYEWRQDLKRREEVLRRLLERLAPHEETP